MLAAVRGADAARAMWPRVQTLGPFTISMALATANILRTDSPSRPSVRAPVVLHSTRSSTCASNYQSFTRPRDFACSSPFGSGGKLSTRTASSPGSFAQGSRTPAPFGRGKPRHQTSSPSALLASAGLTGFPESISQEPAARDAHRANFRGFLARMREHSAETSGRFSSPESAPAQDSSCDITALATGGGVTTDLSVSPPGSVTPVTFS